MRSQPAFCKLCVVRGTPVGVCPHRHTSRVVSVCCRVLEPLAWESPRCVVSTANSVSNFSEPAACTLSGNFQYGHKQLRIVGARGGFQAPVRAFKEREVDRVTHSSAPSGHHASFD